MNGPDEPPEQPAPRWRWFVARRLDRRRHWAISTDAGDDELDEVLRAQGFDPATRSEGRPCDPPPERDEDTSLQGRRWVRIMAEVCTDCVWDAAGLGCLADDLPVSADLRRRMIAWQDWYDRDYDEEDGPFDRDGFAAEGLAIARAVKAELPNWTVVYHDEARFHPHVEARTLGTVPRSTYEYEVTLPEAGG